MMEKTLTSTEANTIGQEKVRSVFAQMRKLGYEARMGFSDCGSCASYELAQRISQKAEAGEDIPLGAVYYSAQSRDDMKETGGVYVNFSGTEDCEGVPDEQGRPSLLAAYDLIPLAVDAGLEVVWSGDEYQAVLLATPERARSETIHDAASEVFKQVKSTLCEAMGVDYDPEAGIDDEDRDIIERAGHCARQIVRRAVRDMTAYADEKMAEGWRFRSTPHVSTSATEAGEEVGAMLGCAWTIRDHLQAVADAVNSAWQRHPDWKLAS